MESTILGRTGLRVTIAGLGCGGHSRLGLEKYGEEHAASIVRCAFDLGVNFFDTAHVYGTQSAVGRGLQGIGRDRYILSSKFPYGGFDNRIKKPQELMDTLEDCLRKLRTEYVDIYHLHGVAKADYRETCETFVPVMQKAREQGKIRFLGITERFAQDTTHEMLQAALTDDIFDVIMVGYNLLNPSAAKTVLPAAMKRSVGVLNMFAVRSALSNPEKMKENLELIDKSGQAGDGFTPSAEVFDFLTEDGAAESIVNAAYRFCRHTPGINVTLTGTGAEEHLKENVRSIGMPRLPDNILARLDRLFGGVDCANAE